LSHSDRGVLVVGSSGHASVVVDALEASGWQVAGFLDDFRPVNEKVLGGVVLGRLQDASACAAAAGVWRVVVAVGDNWRRGQVMQGFDARWEFPVVRHPSAIVSASAQVEAGTVLAAGSVIGPGCHIGRGCLVNTLASLDHDGVLEDYASLAPGAICGGHVRVGSYTAVGLGANVIHKITLGAHTVIGAGATVVADMPDHVVAWGVPARVQRTRQEAETYL
jgi:sugar O-acyltransferase (sialic acid O-acetyltransferase NeuD family)